MSGRYAVMGNPVDHSLSPIIHQLFAQQTSRVLTYEKIKINLPFFEEQVNFFFHQGGLGLNITLPCKERAYTLASHHTPRAAAAKAANTLWRDSNGLHADNTDGIGLLRDLARYIDLAGKNILLVGAGGAARGVLAPLLAAHPAQLTLANRTIEKALALSRDFTPITCCGLSELSEAYDLVINATSASLSDNTLQLPTQILTSTTVCYDLAYQLKAPTPFVAWAQSLGCVAIDGLGMLVEQAAEAFAIWHGVMPDTTPVLAQFR